MEETYETTNLEIGTAIIAVTHIAPVISFDAQRNATLSFPRNQAVADVVMCFESGITVDARTLLTVRKQLYRRVKTVRV